jgi:transcriptional regulator with XRE-family HTH domain
MATSTTPIARLRTARNWTQRDLATHAGTSLSAVATAEQGRTSSRADTVRLLARALGVDEAVLRRDLPPPTRPLRPRATPSPPTHHVPQRRDPSLVWLPTLDEVRDAWIGRSARFDGWPEPVLDPRWSAPQLPIDAPRVVLASGAPVRRSVTKRVLGAAGYRVVAEATDWETLSAVVRAHSCDLVLADFLMRSTVSPLDMLPSVVAAANAAPIVLAFEQLPHALDQAATPRRLDRMRTTGIGEGVLLHYVQDRGIAAVVRTPFSAVPAVLLRMVPPR